MEKRELVRIGKRFKRSIEKYIDNIRCVGVGLDENQNDCIFVYVSGQIPVPSVFEGIKIKVIKTKDFKCQ